jgi:sorting nexin-29
MKSELNKLAKQLKKHNTNAIKQEEYTNMRKNYLSLIKSCKDSYENDIKQKLTNVRNNVEFWKTINSLKIHKPPQNFISLENWQKFLADSQNITGIENCFMSTELRTHDELDGEISLMEIQHALNKMKNCKSPGNDGVSNEFLTNLPYAALKKLAKALNKIFETEEWDDAWIQSNIKMIYKKGDTEKPENYRPIALENSTFKLFMNIINSRLTKWAEENKILPEFQNGFRARRGCIDNIFIINSLVDSTINKEKNNFLYAVFIDFKGAFDNVKHKKLWSHLDINKISTKIIRIIRKIYETAMIRICTLLGKTELVRLIKGLLQGDPLSPLLFNIFLNDLETFFKIRGFHGVKVAENKEILVLSYADDVVLFSKSPVDLRDKLLCLEEYCREKDLTLNTEKTKIIVFKKRIDKKLYQTFQLNNKTIEIVDELKYLGTKLYRTGNWQIEMKDRTTSANFAFNKMKNLILSQKNVCWSTKSTLVNSMVESVLMYGSEVWGVEDTTEVSKAHVKFYKMLLFLPMNTPEYAVNLEVGVKPISMLITERCLSFWIKPINADENSYIKLCYNMLLANYSSSDNWVNRLKRKIFPGELEYIWDNQTMRIGDISWHQTLCYHQQQQQNFILNKINESSSLYWYKYLINENEFQSTSLLQRNLPVNISNTLCQIRLLNIYNEKIYVQGNKYTFNNNQNCTICNFQEKDTLLHLLTKCNITQGLRKHYIKTNDPKIEIFAMLKSQDKEDTYKIVSFVKHALRVRSFILQE